MLESRNSNTVNRASTFTILVPLDYSTNQAGTPLRPVRTTVPRLTRRSPRPARPQPRVVRWSMRPGRARQQ